VIFYSIWLVVLLVSIGFIFSSKTDTFHIKTELIAFLCCSFPFFFLYIFRISSSFQDSFPDWLSPQFPFQMVVILAFLSTICFPLYLSLKEKNFNRQQVGSKLTESQSGSNQPGNKDLLSQILEDATLSQAFTSFCVRSFCIENVLFLEDVFNYRGLKTSEEQKEAAGKMLERYLSTTNPLQINIDAPIAANILRAVQAQLIGQRLFDEARAQVFEQLDRDVFTRWRQTPEFRTLWEQVKREKITV